MAWLLRSTKGYAVKIVNPGGIENWKWNHGVTDLDTPVPPFGVTPRQIVTGLAQAVDELGLPHPIHLHGNHLGEPGNTATTLATMQALSGHRVHFTHLQFHSYDVSERGGYASGAPRIAEYINQHPEFTCDVGQLVFGPATTMTSDAPMEFRLHHLQKAKWGNVDVEMESGAGVVPIVYRPNVLVNAVQWCVGLELMLLIQRPVADLPDHRPSQRRSLRRLSAAHPAADGLGFPAIVAGQTPSPVPRQVTCLHELTREYTLEEIAIVTRAGPARALGLPDKGHLGLGADADVAVYRAERRLGQHVLEPGLRDQGRPVVVRNGEVVDSFSGQVAGCRCSGWPAAGP